MHHLHFNHLALLISALMQWLLGAIWYSLLFAKPWMALTGHTAGSKPKIAALAMVSSFAVSLILSFMLAHVVLWSGADGFGAGAMIGFICWLGFIGGPMVAQHLYESRPFKLYAINAGYWLVAMLASGGMLAVWR
jgi:hypothetical protein